MKIQEGNKLIAEFMGANEATLPFGPDNMQMPTNPFPSGMWTCAVDELEYDKSWDWLMPVVEKIETDASQETGHNEIHITENTCEIYRMSYVKPQFKHFDPKSKIGSVWNVMIQYIEWYNTNNPKTPPHAK